MTTKKKLPSHSETSTFNSPMKHSSGVKQGFSNVPSIVQSGLSFSFIKSVSTSIEEFSTSMVSGKSANSANPLVTPGISQSKKLLVVPVYSKSKVTLNTPPSHSEVSITRSNKSHSSPS